jgi:DNA-binding transcriptional LysR family regulator
MNVHHLELFYFVAKHGGIAAAVRNIPYGIQQPAVSGQIAKLEESLGTKLFQRRPFALSPWGREAIHKTSRNLRRRASYSVVAAR